MNCPICGKEIKNNSKFCTHCGSSLYSNEPNIESKPVNITPQNQQPLPQAQKNPMPYLITFIIAVAIIAAAYVIVNLSGKDSNDNIDSNDELYYDATTEATTEADTPKVVEVPTAAENVIETGDSDDSSTPEGKLYIVQSGDTAQKITVGVYGEYSAELWEKIKKANGKGDTDWVAGEEVKVP